MPDWLTYILLGVIQGLTEFLPVSSSGHLILLEKLLGFTSESVAYEVLLHLATLAAVVWVYRRGILSIARSFLSRECGSDERARGRALFTWIVAGSIATVLVVLPLRGFFEGVKNHPLALILVGGSLFVSGLLMLVLDRHGAGTPSSYEKKWWRSILIGLAQGIAAMPGISRSGATIFTGVLLGVSREDAARYSFLLSIPAILGAFFLEIREISSLVDLAPLPAALGFLAAFASGVLAINWLIRLLTKGRLVIFTAWCWLVSAGAILWFIFS